MRRNILLLTKYNCLSAECANLRAADIKYITQMRDLRKTQVIFLSRQTISKTRPVQIERDFIRTADLEIACSSFRLYKVPYSVGWERYTIPGNTI